MTYSILFWVVAVIGVIFGILDYKGDPNGYRYGYLTWVVILIEICLIGLRVFPFVDHGLR